MVEEFYKRTFEILEKKVKEKLETRLAGSGSENPKPPRSHEKEAERI